MYSKENVGNTKTSVKNTIGIFVTFRVCSIVLSDKLPVINYVLNLILIL